MLQRADFLILGHMLRLYLLWFLNIRFQEVWTISTFLKDLLGAGPLKNAFWAEERDSAVRKAAASCAAVATTLGGGREISSILATAFVGACGGGLGPY